jgi:hypothetical protein
MKRILPALALVASPILAEESKPVATQVGDEMRPAVEAYGNKITRLINQFFASSKGVMGDAARVNLNAQDQRERIANREVRRTIKECIKPESVGDDDVRVH